MGRGGANALWSPGIRRAFVLRNARVLVHLIVGTSMGSIVRGGYAAGYRNYDGSKSTFGDVSVAASVPNPEKRGRIAARRMKDGALTVMVINKYLTMNTPATINLKNFVVGGKAHAWQLTASNAITRLADATVVSGALNVVLPPQQHHAARGAVRRPGATQPRGAVVRFQR